MFKAVVLDSLVVKPGAFAALPLGPAYHTKLGAAATGHMVTALLEFYHGLALVAALPTFVLRLFEEAVGLLVFRALSGFVPLAVAAAANLRLAPPALADLSALLAVDILRLYPLAAPSRGAVYAVSGRVLGELLVPGLLEFPVK